VEQESEQGWFEDPFGVHEHRYFSAGQPTKLVRDNGNESYDPPPFEIWAGPLVPVEEPAGGDATDLRRADDISSRPYDAERAKQAALTIFDQSG
jgi:hypothetical protein